MKSPAVEWTITLAAPIAVNAIRALGEADGDTFCEGLRVLVERTPGGKYLLAGGLTLFYLHIVLKQSNQASDC